jgi:hypothetical protein
VIAPSSVTSTGVFTRALMVEFDNSIATESSDLIVR